MDWVSRCSGGEEESALETSRYRLWFLKMMRHLKVKTQQHFVVSNTWEESWLLKDPAWSISSPIVDVQSCGGRWFVFTQTVCSSWDTLHRAPGKIISLVYTSLHKLLPAGTFTPTSAVTLATNLFRLKCNRFFRAHLFYSCLSVFGYLTAFLNVHFQVQQLISGSVAVESKWHYCCSSIFQNEHAHEILTNLKIHLYAEGGEKFGQGLVPRKRGRLKAENKTIVVTQLRQCEQILQI